MNKVKPTKSPHDYLKQMHRWRMAFFGLVILLAGIVIGASSMSMISHRRRPLHPPPPEVATESLLDEMERSLHLTPKQREKIDPILQEHMQKLDNIRTDARSEINEILGQMNEGITAVLTEQQKQIWQRRLQRLQRQFRPPGRGPGGGGRHRGGQQERMRRGPGHFGPGRRPAGPNMPHNGMHRDMMPRRYEKNANEDL
ncbi:MAG: hypothetical protein FVQ85_21305 [Planctomycetes bacterium]|nr:hypothetical protein [Planctomycetota bacterium]